MPITRIELLQHPTVLELGVASKLLKNARGKSQVVKHLALSAENGVPNITAIGADGTVGRIFGAACLYTQTQED